LITSGGGVWVSRDGHSEKFRAVRAAGMAAVEAYAGAAASASRCRLARSGLGRIVVSELEISNLLVNQIKSG
jgi:hypothetical protein